MKRTSVISLTIVFFTLFGLTGGLFGQRPKPTPKTIRVTVNVDGNAPVPKAEAEKNRRQNAFAQAWQTINDNYFDKTFSGLDWYKIREEYQPRVNLATTDAQVHKIIEEMVARLGKSHFSVIPPEYLATMRKAKAKSRALEKRLAEANRTSDGKQTDTADEPDKEDSDLDEKELRYGIGVDFRLIDNRFVITDVDKQKSGAVAGLRPGFIVDKINGVSLTELVRRINIDYAAVRHLQLYLPGQIVAWFLNGQSGTSVWITCLDENDEPKDYKIERLPLNGDIVSMGSRFPAQFLVFRTASLNEDVGYIKFNAFALPVVDKFCAALTQFASKKALVVDLRGNRGGLIGTLYGLAGMLTDHRLVLGASVYRVGREPLAAKSKNKHFGGKLIFLVDNQSVSAAELFAAGMQDNQRALIVGERTAGEALPSVSTDLATGAVLVYPIANFITINGNSLEGTGVTPNYVVALDRKSLLAGVDPQIEKALALIREGATFPQTKLSVRGDSDDPPPPPPPMRKPAPKLDHGSGPAVVNGYLSSAPPPPKMLPPAVAKDAKALQIIADFTTAIGGSDAFNKMSTYEASGKATIGLHGSVTDVRIRATRQMPDKFALTLSSDAIGDVREIYNGKKSYLQADYGMDIDDFAGADGAAGSELFAPVANILDPAFFKTLTFNGVYEMEGRKLNVMEGKNARGSAIGMAFDVESKMLVRWTPYGASYTLSDYRRVDGIILPFHIGIDRVMEIHLDKVTLNPKIDPLDFEKKEKCFDKPTQSVANKP